MAVWNKPVSWSKFREALTCPRQLQFDLEKVPPSVTEMGWYTGLGHAVQKVYELFYNQGLWKQERTRTAGVLKEIARRVLESRSYDEGIIFNEVLTRDKLEAEVYDQVESGRGFLEAEKLLEIEMRSEHGWAATFRNLRLYGLMDFIWTHHDGTVSVFDGKGSQRENADPRQLLFYALVLHASGKRVDTAALIYWKFGVRYYDVSVEALKKFVDTDYERGAAIFQQLKGGVEKLPANPKEENCQWCSWRLSCEDSIFFKKEFKPEGFVSLEEVNGVPSGGD